MNCYQKNFEYIKVNIPLLYEQLIGNKDQIEVNIQRIGEYETLSKDNHVCYLHSIYSRDNEIRNMLLDKNNEAEGLMIFGVGDGESLLSLIGHFQKSKSIIIIEPSLTVFKNFLDYYDMESLYNNSYGRDVNITFLVNLEIEYTANLIRQNIMDCASIELITHVYIFSIFGDYYKKLLPEIKSLIQLALINVATVSSQWKIWMVNSYRNLVHKNVRTVLSYEHYFRGQQVVLVSAGPSLNRNINYLKDLSKYCTVVAVGTAIRILDSNGITPDFRVAMDAYPAEKKIFEDIKDASVNLLFASQLYYDIVPHYGGPLIHFTLDTDFLCKKINKLARFHDKEFKSGPSIANSALDIICALGAKRVIFMGQDFSYTDEGLHAKGISEEAKQADENWLKDMDMIKEVNIYGETVYTMMQYLTMKKVMESTISEYRNTEFINATEGGLGLVGAVNYTAAEVIDLLKNQLLLNRDLLEEEVDSNRVSFYSDYTLKGIKPFVEEFQKFKQIYLDICKFIRKVEKRYQTTNNGKSSMSDILYIDNLYNELFNTSIYRDVISKDLRADIFVLDRMLELDHSSKEMQLNSKFKRHVGMANKLTDYINLTDELLEELKIIIEEEHGDA